MAKMDIVDRLQSMYYELRQRQAFGNGTGLDGIPELLYDASIKIHDLQGLAFSYPPDSEHNPKGTTWREEYEALRERMTKMSACDFNDWQSVMRDDDDDNKTHGTE